MVVTESHVLSICVRYFAQEILKFCDSQDALSTFWKSHHSSTDLEPRHAQITCERSARLHLCSSVLHSENLPTTFESHRSAARTAKLTILIHSFHLIHVRTFESHKSN